MPYTVSILKHAEKFLRSIKDARLYRRLREAIDSLEVEPHPMGSKKLSGSSDFYRLRVGDHRVLYQVQDQELLVLVIEIGHRREIYR
jgi:mRNA interferase RelE/StbE